MEKEDFRWMRLLESSKRREVDVVKMDLRKKRVKLWTGQK
jgi:hypothetical protein